MPLLSAGITPNAGQIMSTSIIRAVRISQGRKIKKEHTETVTKRYRRRFFTKGLVQNLPVKRRGISFVFLV